MKDSINNAFRGRRVLITGHTGFKGSWLTLWLHRLGAEVYGFSLAPPTSPNNFAASRVADLLCGNVEDDIRARDSILRTYEQFAPELIFHLAAQPIVRESYTEPAETFDINVTGTANLLDAVRIAARPCSVIVVTSDKCYENSGAAQDFREDDRLGGHDPYSASKAAQELLVASYRDSFFLPAKIASHGVKLATVRAGNVIGGGDWARDRIVPDAARALAGGEAVQVRAPRAARPWQHVLDALSGYLLLAATMLADDDPRWCGGWNFGPAETEQITVGQLATLFCDAWGGGRWLDCHDDDQPYEAKTLGLDIRKAASQLHWQPRWRAREAIRRAACWYRTFYQRLPDLNGMREVCLADIAAYESTAGVTTSVTPPVGQATEQPAAAR